MPTHFQFNLLEDGHVDKVGLEYFIFQNLFLEYVPILSLIYWKIGS